MFRPVFRHQKQTEEKLPEKGDASEVIATPGDGDRQSVPEENPLSAEAAVAPVADDEAEAVENEAAAGESEAMEVKEEVAATEATGNSEAAGSNDAEKPSDEGGGLSLDNLFSQTAQSDESGLGSILELAPEASVEELVSDMEEITAMLRRHLPTFGMNEDDQ